MDEATPTVGEVSFGEEVVDGLRGRSEGSVMVPLKRTPYQVVVTVTHAPGSGVVEWRLRTIDPKSGDLPEDAQAGFLPPEDGTGRGQALVTFTVRPRTGLVTGTEVTDVSWTRAESSPSSASRARTMSSWMAGPARPSISDRRRVLR